MLLRIAVLVAVLAAPAVLPPPASSQEPDSAASPTVSVSVVNEGAPEPGAPWGRVRSDPPGVACPEVCEARFDAGTTVVLTAEPEPGYVLSSWNVLPNDPACAAGPTCTITVDGTVQTHAVTASFKPAALLEAATAGPGRLAISPSQPGKDTTCKLDAQQEAPDSSCSQGFPTGTRVTLTALPDADRGARFVGWSDYRCRAASTTCTLPLAAGTTYVTARFSPVQLSVQGTAFGAVTVEPGGTCPAVEDGPACSFAYPSGAVVTLRRERPAPGLFWVGTCLGNHEGLLDAEVCRVRLDGDELIGAGYDNAAAIPPPRGAGLVVVRRGRGRGTVTGRALTTSGTLRCGSMCALSGLDRYDKVQLTARARRGSRFAGWSDGVRLRTRLVQLSSVSRIAARFDRRSRRR